MKKTEYFALTGETVVLDMTKDEIAEVAELKKQYDAEQLAKQAEAEAKAQAKAAAEGKLAALGLTTDDLRALGL
jgi:hypothetical protein